MSHHSVFDLSGTWNLRSADGRHHCPITLPGDVHSALIAAGIIPDPYFADNEDRVTWVAETDWILERTVTVAADLLARRSVELDLDQIDTYASVRINGTEVGTTHNQFRRWRFDAKPLLRVGDNTITVTIESPIAVANRKGELQAKIYPIPHNHGSFCGIKVRHINLLRKSQCHAGWDWGISVMASGIYGTMALCGSDAVAIRAIGIVQHHRPDQVGLTVTVEADALIAGSHELAVAIDGQVVKRTVSLAAGRNSVQAELTITNPRLWWPAGQGEQPLYGLAVTLGEARAERRIGLRSLTVDVSKDAIGHRLAFVVNGREIFAKGANWIPADAIPGRQAAHIDRLLRDAARANMNMIRIWGGGQYESEQFYDRCDELGLLVWQDCMFACAMYPAEDAYLAEITTEVTQQVKRLQHRACIALWCGDNENLGAMSWFEDSRKNRDRYLADYVRLDDTRRHAVNAADPTRLYWTSSPCNGPHELSDNIIGSGDDHYWAVWHGGKDLEDYHNVRSRFVSEFGFQSFPSLETVKTCVPESDWNISAPLMEFHQRNGGGNAKINDMFGRRYRMPVGFANTLFLSQVQQAEAMRIGVEFWRTLRPLCMGSLIWQLNDTWPVASWSSIEYSGRWRVLHHAIRRFYAPVLATAHQKDGQIQAHVVNDEPMAGEGVLEISLLGFDGTLIERVRQSLTLAPGSSTKAGEWPADRFAASTTARSERFLHLAFTGSVGGRTVRSENVLFLDLPKKCRLADAAITTTVDGLTVTVASDAPAFHVTLVTEGLAGEFDDNAINLLPGRPRTLTFVPEGPADQAAAALAQVLAITHLRATY